MIGMLGRLPTKRDTRGRTLRALDFLDLQRPAPPMDRSWASLAIGAVPMFRNDVLPCCVISALAHSLRVCSAAAGHQIVVSDADVLAAYRQIEQPGGGAYCLDGLKLAKRQGIGGHKLLAYAENDLADPHAEQAVLAAVEVCGAVYGGYDLPKSAKAQTVWDVPAGGPIGSGAPRSWGGHAMAITAQDVYSRSVQTWGRTQRMTAGFDRTYRAECYLVVWGAWLVDGRSPTGLDVDALLAAVATIT